MAQHPNRRVSPQTIQADQTTTIAVQSFADYNPLNPTYRKDALAEKRAAMEAARVTELHAQNALNAARDAAAAAEWEFHQAVIGVKEQVIAQYGSDSDQVRALGLKKKSDRKRRVSRFRVESAQTRSGSQPAADA